MYKLGQSIYNEWFIKYNYKDNVTFKDSEIGKIPANWNIGHIDDGILTKIIKSGVEKYDGIKKYVATADVSDISINSFSEIEYKDKPSRANMTPIENSVWFAKMENSKKNIIVDSYMKDLINNYIFSTGFMGLLCKNNSLYYIWNYINSPEFEKTKNNLSTGTLMAGISNSTISSAMYPIPDDNTLLQFNNIERKIYNQIYANNIENNNLIKLRDTLLPKLMNGEIDLDKVEI